MNSQHREKVIATAVARMKAYTAPAIAAVYGVESAQRGQLIGSGTFINIRGTDYLLTASHVLETAVQYSFLAHSLGYGEKPCPLPHPFRLQQFPCDLGLTQLADEPRSSTAIRSMPATVLDTNSADIEGDVLFIHGYPGEQSKWLPIMKGGIHSTSLPFCTVVRSCSVSWPHFTDVLHSAVEYWPTGWRDENGTPIERTDAHGLSGSAVWRLSLKRFGTAWTPENAHIIGVLHRVDPSGDCLIFTRIEEVRDFILRNLRREFAFLAWLRRNKPEHDDWTDWFAAVAAIPAIDK